MAGRTTAEQTCLSRANVALFVDVALFVIARV